MNDLCAFVQITFDSNSNSDSWREKKKQTYVQRTFCANNMIRI